MNSTPPKWIDYLLEFLLKDRFVDETLGDLQEWYEWKQASFSATKLHGYYLLSAVKAIRFYKVKRFRQLLITLIDLLMLNNNFKIGIRSLLHQKFFTLINIVGLTISLTAFLFIFSFVNFEMSYDRFHPKSEDIYRVLIQNKTSAQFRRSTPTPAGAILESHFRGDVETARFGQDAAYMEVNGKKSYESDFYWSDPSVFSIFELPFLYGNVTKALEEPNTLVLTQEVAEKYFGERVNPVGELITVKIYDSDVELSMRVDGVLQALPPNTDLPFKALGSMKNALELYSQFNEHWNFFWLHTYAHIPSRQSLERIENQLPQILESLGRVPAGKNLAFQPLEKVHLYSGEVLSAFEDGNINHIITFSIIGSFIVFIAIINYLNLVSARASKRFLEVNVRKILGANKGQLLGQFITEANLTILISLVLAMILVIVLWPIFQGAVSKEIPLMNLFSWKVLLTLIGSSILLGSLAGGYPAWMLISLKTGRSIYQEKVVRKGRTQKVLVTFQFMIAVFLLLSTLVIFRQVNFMTGKSLGFNEEQLISIKVEDRSLQRKIELIKEEMKTVPGVAAISASGESLPSDMNNTAGLNWSNESGEGASGIDLVSVDQDFFATLEMPLLQGTNFTQSFESDSARSIVINEAAALLIGKPNPVNAKVIIDGIERRVIGMVPDHHYQSLKSKVAPLAFLVTGTSSRLNKDNLIVRLASDDIVGTVKKLDQVWTKFSQNEIFSFHFVDESFQRIYDTETRFLQLFSVFSVLSIVICGLGLYGIVLFVTEEKSKEISTRKVLGSSVGQIVFLISKSFLILLLIGFVLGAPLAIYFSKDWLSQFQYHIEIDAFSVILSALALVFVASATIGVKTLKAANANPVKYLRNE